ncbi:MAG: hypothetical protein LIO67_02610 [Lachnospiraceae bacterium]|nr:hypothetical protein [Lachnospiraceae bacterium]
MKRRVAALLMAVVLCGSSLPVSAEEASPVTTVAEETAEAGSEETQEATPASSEEETPAEETGTTEEETVGEEGKTDEAGVETDAEPASSEETVTVEASGTAEASAEIPALAEGGTEDGETVVASVGGTEYKTLQDAITTAEKTGATVKLVVDDVLSSALSVTGTVTLDLNGKKISEVEDFTDSNIMAVTGSLTIQDSGASVAAEGTEATGGSIVTTTTSGIVVDGGTLMVKGGTIQNTNSSADTACGINLVSGSVDISGGSIEAKYGIIQESGALKVSGGKITGSYAGIHKKNGTLTVSNGDVVGCYYGIKSDNGIVNITGGMISTSGAATTASSHAVYLSGGTLNASGGTITAAPINYETYNYWFYGITVRGNTTQVTVNLSGNVTVTALNTEDVTGYGAAVVPWNDTMNPDTPTILNVSGKAVLNGASYGISGNGGAGGAYYTEINISGGEITGEWGIYHPQIGTLNISGGTIIGNSTGVEIRSGELNVTGGTIIGKGSPLDSEGNGNGTTTVGAGIAIAQHTTKNTVAVSISGGTISGYTAVSEANTQENASSDLEKIDISITGGTFTSTNTADGATALSIGDMGTISTEITGGSYNTDVDAYIDPGYKLTYNTRTQSYSVAVQTASGAVASITRNGTTTYYTPLSDAIQAAGTTSTTIKLLANVTGNITIESGQKITLDLGKYTLTNDGKDVKSDDNSIVTYCDTISNHGTLTITGSGKIDNVTEARGALVNYPGGVVTIKGGTLTRSQEAASGNSWYTIKNLGTITITDGATVTTGSGGTGNSSLIDNGWYNSSPLGESESLSKRSNDREIIHDGSQTANLTITGGTFSGGMNVVKNDDYGVLDISGGSFSNSTGAVILNWNVATISGGTFTLSAENYAILNNGYSSGGGDEGIMTITGGTFVNTIEGGRLFGHPYDPNGDGNYTYGGGTVTITGGDFTGCMDNSEDFTSTYYDVNISGGSFSKEVPAAFCADGYAPVTSLDATTGKYTVTVDLDEGYVVRILDASGNNLNAYESLANAITAVGSGQTIELLADVATNITIASEKSFTLDLNGHSLIGSVTTGEGGVTTTYTLTNSGTLTIKNSGSEGAVETAITNNASASLTITNGTVTGAVTNASGATMTVKDGSFSGALTNNGTLTINDGSFTGTVTNASEATMTISDGSFTNSITNSGSLTISGGSVKNSSEAAVVNSGALVISGGVLSGKDSCIQIAGNNAPVQISGGTLTGSVIIAAGSEVTSITTNSGSTITGGYFNGKLYDTSNTNTNIAAMLKGSISFAEDGDLHFTDLPASQCRASGTAYASNILTVDGVTYCYTVIEAGEGLTATLKQDKDENPNYDVLTVSLPESDWSYTGSAIKPEPLIITEEGLALQKGTDYTLSYKNNVNVADSETATKKPTVVIRGVGNYSDLYQEIYFNIIRKDISTDVTSYVANVTASSGVLKKSAPTLTYNNRTLRVNTDYTLDYAFAVVDTGFKVTVTAYGKGNYNGKLKDTYYVFSARQNLATLYSNSNNENASISLAISGIESESYSYTGTAQKPVPVLTLTIKTGSSDSDTETLVPNKDYTVGYRNNVNAGSYANNGTKAPTIVITGKGCYSGSVTLYFTINQADLTATDATLYTYIKNPTAEITNVSKLTTTVKLNGKTLRRNTDYTVAFEDGDYSAHVVTITGKGNYSNTEEINVAYSVGRADLSTVTVSSIAAVTYDTTAQKPEPVLTDGGYTLVKGVDYTVGYRNNVNAGSYASNGTKAPTVVITGIGNYKGTLTKYFTIKPRTLSEENSDFTFTVSDVKEGRKLTTSALVVKYKNRVLRQNTTTTYQAVITDSNDLLNATEITATGQGNYTGSVTVNVHRYTTELSTLTVVVAPAYYTGSALTPDVVVYNRAGEKLEEGIHYEITYSNNIKVGWGTVTVKGCADSEYGGNAKTVRFTIGARSILDVLKSFAQKVTTSD